MFRIKRDQMEHFNTKTRTKFSRMLAEYLRAEFAEWVRDLDEPALFGWVDACVEKADRYRVRTEPEVAQLVLLFLLLGSNADEELDWVGETLRHRDLEAVGKVRRLIAGARAREVEGLDAVLVYSEFVEQSNAAAG